MALTLIYLALGLLFLIFIGLLVWAVILQVQVSRLKSVGNQWNIVYGSTTQASDIITTGGGTLFIAQSSAISYVVSINPNDASGTGQNIWIKNNSPNIITVQAGSGVSISSGFLTNTINSGSTGEYVYTTANNLLRLN